MSKRAPAGKPVVKVMRLDALTVDPELQSRVNGLTAAVVDEYAEALRDGAEFPPLVVYSDTDTGKHWLSEGFHRHAAYLKAGRAEVECEVREGDRGSALFNSCGSNRTHGLRRSSADKRFAIEKMLAEFPECSDRWIADGVGCDHKTVAAVRNPKPDAKRSNGHTGEFPQCNGLNDNREQGTLPGCGDDGVEAVPLPTAAANPPDSDAENVQDEQYPNADAATEGEPDDDDEPPPPAHSAYLRNRPKSANGELLRGVRDDGR